MATAWIRILDWRKYQHYKDRSPPWIKLHREQVLDSRRYRALADASKALLVDLMVLASEEEGKVKYDLADLQYRLRRVPEEMVPVLEDLARARFIALPDQGQGDLLADACTVLPRVEESRGEAEKRRNGGNPQLQEVKESLKRQLTGEEPVAPRMRKP